MFAYSILTLLLLLFHFHQPLFMLNNAVKLKNELALKIRKEKLYNLVFLLLGLI